MTRLWNLVAGGVAAALIGFLMARVIAARYQRELRRSRDELRRGLERLGSTLGATHDLEAMLDVILETAVVTLGAVGGALFLMDRSGRELRLEAALGFDHPRGTTLRLGQGVAGLAATGQSVVVPPQSSVVRRASVEPEEPTALAVPLVRGDRTMGVLALYGRSTPGAYSDDDVGPLLAFAAQASVAIDNVLLHQEAQRLSITDGLTGVWNRRYLMLTLGKEIERAQRFERPLSVLMVDIDHFKRVNDDHGHLRGDEVLVEVTQRISREIRSQIDVLARYGGEEFLIVLPETPAEGARVAAGKILEAVRSTAFTSDEGPDLWLTVSIGVASFPNDGGAARELIGAADVALY
ncbi:MAG: GGDEF domain-containing protein, partial [Actinomycetota bacterium]|nr:GGDEF domain-containing protein [Actinomycetota bacterium]